MQDLTLVIPAKYESESLPKVINDLKHTNFTTDGVVLNAMTEEHSYGAGYYYNYYQYYYNEQ